MKKRLQSLFLFLLVCVVMISLVGCGKGEPETSRVTIDINPSVEFIVDEENKVVSVTALNDDASLLLVGEVIVGKTLEDATEVVINLAIDTGYLADGESEQKVSFTVSGDSKYAENLKKDISKSIDKFLDEKGIEAQVEQANALALDGLKSLVLKNSTYTEEEVSQMTEEELIDALRISRIETAELINVELKELYFEAKEYEIAFVEREETAKIIESLGAFYTLIHSGYSEALKVYRQAIDNVQTLKYETFISPDSQYQKTLVKVRDQKVLINKQKELIVGIENEEERENALQVLNQLESDYDKFVEAFESARTHGEAAFDTLIEAMKKAEAAFTSIEQKFDANINNTLTSKASEIEAKLNETKDHFFAEFETKYAEDIKRYEDTLKAKKEELKK